jgi:hypothetical protein
MISTMNVAQMEEVTPWELYPIPTSVQRSITTGSGLTNEERDRKMVRVYIIIFSLGFCSATFGVSSRHTFRDPINCIFLALLRPHGTCLG